MTRYAALISDLDRATSEVVALTRTDLGRAIIATDALAPLMRRAHVAALVRRMAQGLDSRDEDEAAASAALDVLPLAEALVCAGAAYAGVQKALIALAAKRESEE